MFSFNFIKFTKRTEDLGVLGGGGSNCNCGSWGDPSWTAKDYRNKAAAMRLCPVHKNKKGPTVMVGGGGACGGQMSTRGGAGSVSGGQHA